MFVLLSCNRFRIVINTDDDLKMLQDLCFCVTSCMGTSTLLWKKITNFTDKPIILWKEDTLKMLI